MARGLVYASGPIYGITYEACTTWRKELRKDLASYGIEVISPMRYKEMLNLPGRIGIEVSSNAPLCSSKGVYTRDLFDVRRCDIMFVNLLGATRVSIGTVSEIAIAEEQKKPIVLVMEKDNIHNHPFVTEPAGFWLDDYREGVGIVKALLGAVTNFL